MSDHLFLSQVKLRQDASIKSLIPLLLGEHLDSSHSQAGHHLVWSLFSDGPDRKRDFLWREVNTGEFLVLSTRPPENRHFLFDVNSPKLFTPQLREGQRLRFSLRANPIVRSLEKDDPRAKRQKHDVVMHSLRHVPRGKRADERRKVIQQAGYAWLLRQAAQAGFDVKEKDLLADHYRQHRITRSNGERSLTFSSLDFDGVLTVSSPTQLLTSIKKGFGSAKAFGCGLMLIRKVTD